MTRTAHECRAEGCGATFETSTLSGEWSATHRARHPTRNFFYGANARAREVHGAPTTGKYRREGAAGKTKSRSLTDVREERDRGSG